MKVVRTDDLPRNMGRELQLWVYNGLDCMLPLEIHDEINRQLDDNTNRIYRFELACRAPALQMMLRGIRIDGEKRWELLKSTDPPGLEAQFHRIDRYFQRIAYEIWGDNLNHNSPTQLKQFFYSHLGLPPQFKYEKGEKKLTTNREALEKLRDYYQARAFVNAILALKDLDSQIKVLKFGVDSDGRMRTSFNVGADVTGRWSSSKNVHDTGTNFQNITPDMREMYVADEDYILFNVDLEQAESRAVAYLSGDENYIAACESSGDLHTAVAKMVWPHLDWTGDPEGDRKVADQPCYRHFTYRDLAKRGGHATNYLVSAWTLARHLKIERSLAEEFQERYFQAFPGIREWHRELQAILQTTGMLMTPLGRVRNFFGRLNDEATLRRAVAHVPQSLVSDICKLGLFRIWKYLEGEGVQILAEGHDSVLGQFPVRHRDEFAREVVDTMTIPVGFSNRVMTIPAEVKLGYNWKEMAKPGSEELADLDKVHAARSVSEDPLSWKIS
jgi:DNA polymerase-1